MYQEAGEAREARGPRAWLVYITELDNGAITMQTRLSDKRKGRPPMAPVDVMTRLEKVTLV